MKMIRMLIQVPATLKAKLDAERRQGTTASGLIRHLLEQHFRKEKGTGYFFLPPATRRSCTHRPAHLCESTTTLRDSQLASHYRGHLGPGLHATPPRTATNIA